MFTAESVECLRIDSDGFDDETSIRPSRSVPPGGGRKRGEDEELNRAIEASKRSLQDEQARTEEENDLQRAIRLSEEEEAKRKRALEDANARSLFDDTQQPYVSSQLRWRNPDCPQCSCVDKPIPIN